MTVQCPRCGTRYRQPARSGLDADTTYRCARCRHVFDALPDEPVMLESDEDADDEARFTFEEEAPDERFADDEDAEAEEPDEPAGARRATPARFALRALLGVTLAYAVLSVYLHTHPDEARQTLRRVPLLGARLTETRLHPAHIQLGNLRGEYQRVQGDRLVFVISGTATNNAPIPVRGIQIEGRIKGAQEQRQVVFCGVAQRDIQNLSLREIALLQTLEPSKDWSLAPGEQASFVVVFAGPPTDLSEFAAEVVAVQAPTRG
jgi:predicted Zn finger-like uncharacterized protein